jgi:hypothetical protein
LRLPEGRDLFLILRRIVIGTDWERVLFEEAHSTEELKELRNAEKELFQTQIGQMLKGSKENVTGTQKHMGEMNENRSNKT